jgi:diacylglycerol kinase family enzyme
VFAVILNPGSGGLGRPRLRAEVEQLFRHAGIEADIHELGRTHEITTTAQEVLRTRPDAIVAGGGDGTISAVAAVVSGTPTPLGVLPLGTLNHFAKDAHIPLDLPKAVQVIAGGHVKRIDVGRVNERTFVNNCSIGVYPSVVETRQRLREGGHSKWSAFALAMVRVLQREDGLSIRLEVDRTKIVAQTPFVFVGNNEYLVEGIKLGARTRLDGGRLYAYFAPPVRTRDLPKLFARAVFGRARREHALESISAAELWVDVPLAREVSVACDGELLTLATPLRYRSCPGALRLLSPA